MFAPCPGSRLPAEPIPEPIAFPHFGKEVEIFTNEQSLKCYFCGGLVTREKRPCCLDRYKYADKCIAEIESAVSNRQWY